MTKHVLEAVHFCIFFHSSPTNQGTSATSSISVNPSTTVIPGICLANSVETYITLVFVVRIMVPTNI